MEFIDVIKSRRSIRSFLDKNVPDELILKMLDAARYAPSGGNCQPWHFYVIRNKEMLKQLNEKVYKSSWFAEAPVAIVICANIPESERRYQDRGRNLYCIQDTAAASQNILLCARDLGLGGCWVGAFNEEQCREILGLEKDMRPVVILPIGYPSSEPSAPQRKSIEEITTFINN